MSSKIRKSIILHKWFEKTLKEDDIIKFDYPAFENIQEIGRGGFGIVYSAYHGGEIYALKTFKSDEANKEVTKDFIKELKQLHTVTSHPNINRFYGITRETFRVIKNRNKDLIPALDITINEQPQFYKTMHNDDLSKALIRTTSILKPRRSSNSISKASGDSITKTSSATSEQKTRESSLSGSKNSKRSMNKSIKEFFFGQKRTKKKRRSSQNLEGIIRFE
ncbi:12844_t:CDS:2, partial [Gigaspora rosea]